MGQNGKTANPGLAESAQVKALTAILDMEKKQRAGSYDTFNALRISLTPEGQRKFQSCVAELKPGIDYAVSIEDLARYDSMDNSYFGPHRKLKASLNAGVESIIETE